VRSLLGPVVTLIRRACIDVFLPRCAASRRNDRAGTATKKELDK